MSKKDTLALREKPDAKSKKIADIPFDADGLKFLDDSLKLSDGEISQMTQTQKKKAYSSRWVKIDYSGKIGWSKASFLVEGICAD